MRERRSCSSGCRAYGKAVRRQPITGAAMKDNQKIQSGLTPEDIVKAAKSAKHMLPQEYSLGRRGSFKDPATVRNMAKLRTNGIRWMSWWRSPVCMDELNGEKSG